MCAMESELEQARRDVRHAEEHLERERALIADMERAGLRHAARIAADLHGTPRRYPSIAAMEASAMAGASSGKTGSRGRTK